MRRKRIRAGTPERRWRALERAGQRFMRRRQAWIEATEGEHDFERAIAHPAWTLVDQANDLLLRLG